MDVARSKLVKGMLPILDRLDEVLASPGPTG
jgi:hypothetical protein